MKEITKKIKKKLQDSFEVVNSEISNLRFQYSQSRN